ncbi:hypothetical protein DMI70_12015 [Escherichia coli]|nr:hypothetical protein [Escherichia coli]
MKTRTRKEGLKRRNKEEYEMDRLTRANASKIRAMKQFYWHLPEKIRFSTAKTGIYRSLNISGQHRAPMFNPRI